MSSVIFWVISVLALSGVILASKYQVEWLTQALTFGGIIASAFGVKMSFSQIKNVKDIAEETKKAVNKNKKEIREFLSITEILRLIQISGIAKELIERNEFVLATTHISNLNDDLIRISSLYFPAVPDNKFKTISAARTHKGNRLKKLIGDIKFDLNSLSKEKMKDPSSPSTLNKEKITAHLDDTHNLLIEFECEIKKNKL